MNPLIASKVAQAQQDAEKVFYDNPVHSFDENKIRFGRDFVIETSGDGAVVTAEIKDNRPKEPGLTPAKSTPAATKAAEIGTWGKPSGKGL